MEFAFDKHGYSIIRCPRCGLYATWFDKSYDQFLADYYDEGYFVGIDDKYGYSDYFAEEKMIRKNNASYLRGLKRFCSSGNLLDVGCAAGFLMDESEKVGFKSYGIDTSPFITAHADKNLQNRIQTSSLHRGKFEDSFFDVVTMFDLVEHLNDPVRDLKKIRTVMKDTGVLMISTGDVGSLYARLLGKHNHFFAPPHHFFYFSRETITEMLRQSGFEVVRIESRGKWLSYPYITRVARHFSLPLLEKFLGSAFMKRMLYERSLYLYFGDNMIVYAKKALV